MVEHRLELFRELALGNIMNQAVFLDAPLAGPSSSDVICNSVPKSGTYLLVELVKALGGHVNVGYHTYSSSISRLLCNETFQKLVVEFGYEPTRRMSPSQISRGLAVLRNILPARQASGSF